MPTFTYNASGFADFAKDLRSTSPELRKRMRSAIGKAGRAAATKMRAEMPHQHSGGGAGVRFSDSFSSKGAAIVIGGQSAPRSYAFAFGVGNRGPGKYKHPVYGHWSSSPKTVMPISDYVVRGWAELGPVLMAAADAAVQEVVEVMAHG